MFKNVIICILFVMLVSMAVLNLLQRARIDSSQKATIRAKEAKELAESQEKQARNALNSVRDSLETMGIVLVGAHRDVEKARSETKKAKEEAKKIVFTVLRSDKERDSVLTLLYPSLKSHPDK